MQKSSRALPRLAAAFIGAGLLAVASTAVLGQAFPTHPIRVIYNYPPGSGGDDILRMVGGEVAKSLGQPFVVETRPGASGRLGLQELKNSRGDAHLLSSIDGSNVVVVPLEEPDFKMEVMKDFVPVAGVYAFEMTLVANAGLPFHDIKGLVEYGKANPGKLNFANTGVGSAGHLAMLQLADRAGISVTHVPYKGQGQYLPAIASGEASVALASLGAYRPFVDSGKVVVLGATGRERSPLIPNIPTVREQGVQFDYGSWFGLAAPPDAPADAVARLNTAITAAIKQQDIVTKLHFLGYVDYPATPEAFTATIRRDVDTWRPVVARVKLN
jgi:tripartite-type tricarboxylate transporter receptor subunit TctC